MKQILAFAGSNSSESINRKLLELAAESIDSAEVTLIDLRNYPVPMYSMDIEEETGIPSEVKRLKAEFEKHDAFLISSPEHNGMMPAFFKNTMDWLSRAGGKIFQEKPVMLMSASAGPRGGAINLNNMKNVLPHWGASTLFSDFSLGSFHQKYDADNGALRDPADTSRLRAAIEAFERHLA